jgi:hypothetical protein
MLIHEHSALRLKEIAQGARVGAVFERTATTATADRSADNWRQTQPSVFFQYGMSRVMHGMEMRRDVRHM